MSEFKKIYLSNSEAWSLLGVSKASFYRHHYKKLINHSTTMEHNGSPRYLRETVLACLKPIELENAFSRRLHMKTVRAGKQRRYNKSNNSRSENAAENPQLSLPIGEPL